MAAETDANTPVEAPAISEPQAVPKTSDDLQNGDSYPPSVNDIATSGSSDDFSTKRIADNIDDLVNSAEPSNSGGSDTEASRPDPAKSRDGEDKGHVRTSSLARKPATFKSVSVNKTFLAAKLASAPGVAKPGDRASPTLGTVSLTTASSATARPRLIAKTGLVKGASANGRPVAAPDPNAVWNKNRRKNLFSATSGVKLYRPTRSDAEIVDLICFSTAAAPVPEPRKLTDEELKKYGIHISTRLQQEDEAKGQNNWADIEDDDEDWAPEEITWTDGTKSTIPHHDDASQPSPQAHIVQPEIASAQPLVASSQPSPTVPISLLAKDNELGEKPKLLAPSGIRVGGLPSGRGLILKGAPEKPVLVAKPPAPPTPLKSPWASLPPVDKASPVTMDLPPAIGSARMPYQQQQHLHQYHTRDMYGGPPKGLSLPPAPFKEIAADDFSRGGFRDSHHMNRELFNSHSGRLEPVTDRRGNNRSDVHYKQPPSAVLQRQSHSLDHQAEPTSAIQTHRMGAQEGSYSRRRNSSNVSGASGGFLQHLGRTHDQSGSLELHDTQRQSHGDRSISPSSLRNHSPSGMRLRQTRGSPASTFAAPYSNPAPDAILNAPHSGGPYASRGASQAVSPSIEDELEVQKKIMRERRELAKKRRLEEEEREEAAKRERIRLKLEAMGPAPERKSAKKEITKEEPVAAVATPATPPQANAQLSTLREGVVADVNKLDDSYGSSIHGADSHSENILDSVATYRQPQPQQQQQQQTWQSPVRSQGEHIGSWGGSNQARNVWGSPNNRSLGNGTFTSDLGPIGPPSGPVSVTGPSISPIGPPKTIVSLPPPPLPTSVHGMATRPAVVTPTVNSNTSEAARSAWANAVKASDEIVLAQRRSQQEEQQRDAEARGLTLKDLRPTVKDTWMPTRMNDDGNRVEDKGSQSIVYRPGSTVGSSSSPPAPIHSQQPRLSRFFPTRDARLEGGIVSAAAAPAGGGNNGGIVGTINHNRPISSSPPPPDMDGHPAFDGDVAHPHVSLPKPQIVVRLPPKSGAVTVPTIGSSQQQKPLQRDAVLQPSHVQATFADSDSWQAKFNNLFDRKAVVPPTKLPLAVSRSESQAQGSLDATRASPLRALLPRKLKPIVEEPPTTRLMAEDCFARQEMGSLPLVHLPNKVPELAWTPADVPKPLPRRFLLLAATSADHEGFLKDCFGTPHAISIHFPGMTGAIKSVNLPTSRTVSSSRRPGYGRGGNSRHGSSNHRGGNKGRDTSSSHAGSQATEKVTPPNTRQGSSGGRSRGGGMRHRSETWTQSAPAPVQT
ncbi:hypothetical protein SEPCBS57363_006075 [Sporothrix epigloea]|uniref:Uncharacterized protein n=1 Tax=Sporothrix epigloea TaxID=1892477 RepID=A0ABP0E120_9PEZI